MRKDKVSVAMATYNGEKYIYEQIKTILRNLTESDELIVSDDGSIDKTLEIIEKINDNRIKLIKGTGSGIKQNFENAIKHTTGDYIFLADQDDMWLDNKIDKTLEHFYKSDAILIQHDAVVIDENQNILYNSFAEHRKVKTGIIKNLIKNSYHGCCIAFKKELKNEILPIPNNIYLHDAWIGLIAELNGNTKFINEKLIKYRRHLENTSSFRHLPLKEMIKNRVNYTKELLKYIKDRKK